MKADPEFLYVRGGAATYPPGATFGPRVLEDFELVWIQRGEVTYQANGKEYAAPPGTVILARPGFREMYRWDPKAPTRHAFFHFQRAALSGRSALPPLRDWPVALPMPERDIVRPLFDYIVGQLARSPGNQLARPLPPVVARALEALLAAFVLGPQSPDRVREEARISFPEPLHLVLQWMGQTIAAGDAQPVALSRLAAVGMVSDQHLCRLFQRHLSLSPVHAHTALRLNRAIDLMARTDLKMQAIAEACGFATLQHFSRRFKAFYGQAPTAIRPTLATTGTRPQPLRWGAEIVISY